MNCLIVVALDLETAKNSLHPNGFPALANLPGFGLVTRVDTLSRLLQQPTDQIIGRLENSRAHQYLQLDDGVSLWALGFKPRDQLLDFRFLGQEDGGGDGLFFNVARFWRVSAITNSAYCWVSCWNWA